jgi:hypothetical protein
MAILTKLKTSKITLRIVQYNERLMLFRILRRSALFLDPRSHAPIKIHHICFSAVRAEVKIVVRKGPIDFVEKRLRHKEGAAFLTGFQFDRSNLLLREDLEKLSRTDLVPEFSRVFRARIYTGSAADALVMGVVENPGRPLVLRLDRARGAAQLA